MEKYTLPIGAKLQSPKRVYTIEQVLGQGGFGITYKVSAQIRVDNVTVRTFFAVKEFFMKDSCERDSHDSVCYSSPVKDKVEESKKDFLAEAQRLNKISLEHPNLIHVNEVFEANNTVYYVMEYLDGGSLRSYVHKHGLLSEHEALEIMQPIFKAVDFLHQNRMTHLDIKPDNIMLKIDADSGKIIPVLIDFGLSKHYDKNGKPTSSIRVLGCSDGYAPMEQYVGINTFTPQADVYALAATLLYLLTGKDPVVATEQTEEKISKSLSIGINEKTKRVIVRAMKMRKEERFQSVSSFSCVWEQSSKESKLKSESQSTKTLNLKSVQSKRNISSRIIKGGIGMLAILLVYMFVLWNKGGKNTSNEVVASENFVDLGLSVKWADRNVGAGAPEDLGNLYRWNEYKGKCNVPKKKEFEELIKNCTWKYQEYFNKKGMMFTSKINGKSIFFPVTGVDDWTHDLFGKYWTATYAKGVGGCTMEFYEEEFDGKPFVNEFAIGMKFAIRPVCKK